MFCPCVLVFSGQKFLTTQENRPFVFMAFQLIDMRHPATEFDISMLDFMSQKGIPYTVILTKSDKLNKTETQNRLSLIREELGEFAENTEIIPFSAQNNDGVEKLREVIENILK